MEGVFSHESCCNIWRNLTVPQGAAFDGLLPMLRFPVSSVRSFIHMVTPGG